MVIKKSGEKIGNNRSFSESLSAVKSEREESCSWARKMISGASPLGWVSPRWETKLTSDWSVETMLENQETEKECRKVQKKDQQKVEVKGEGGNAERTQQLTNATLSKFIMKTKTTTIKTVS